MKLGIFAKTFPRSGAFEVFFAVRQAGYAAVQYNMACSGPDETPGSIAEAARAHGVEIAAVSATYNMIHPDTAVCRRGLESLRKIAASAHAMGTRLLTLCTGTLDAEDQWRHHPDNGTPATWRALLENMTAALAIADEFDVELGIEPEFANVVSSAERARRLIGELRSPRLRIVLDAANLFEVESLDGQRAIVAAGIDLLADRIAIAHAKDRRADGGFTAAGLGVLDYAHYLRCLRSAGFNGPLIAHGLEETDAMRVAQFLSQYASVAP